MMRTHRFTGETGMLHNGCGLTYWEENMYVNSASLGYVSISIATLWYPMKFRTCNVHCFVNVWLQIYSSGPASIDVETRRDQFSVSIVNLGKSSFALLSYEYLILRSFVYPQEIMHFKRRLFFIYIFRIRDYCWMDEISSLE